MFTKRSDIFRARSREFSATNPWVRLSRSVRVYGRERSETASALRGSRQPAADANGACAGANIFAPTSKPRGSNFRADTRNSCPCTPRQQLCCRGPVVRTSGANFLRRLHCMERSPLGESQTHERVAVLGIGGL